MNLQRLLRDTLEEALPRAFMEGTAMLVKFFATYRIITGCRSCTLTAPATVSDLFAELVKQWPAFREELLNEDGTDKGSIVRVMVNGRHIEHLDGMATKLSDDDVVAITPQVAGG